MCLLSYFLTRFFSKVAEFKSKLSSVRTNAETLPISITFRMEEIVTEQGIITEIKKWFDYRVVNA